MRLPPGRLKQRRPGAAAPWVLLSLPLRAAAFALAVNVAGNNQTQVELQIAADAAALAGANAEAPAFVIDPNNSNAPLAPDILLTTWADRLSVMLANAQQAAQTYGAVQPGRGQRPDPRQANSDQLIATQRGELVFGTAHDQCDSPVRARGHLAC